jgi:hypothetical protein
LGGQVYSSLTSSESKIYGFSVSNPIVKVNHNIKPTSTSLQNFRSPKINPQFEDDLTDIEPQLNALSIKDENILNSEVKILNTTHNPS